MTQLEYKSLVTKENIDHYLSIIKNETEKTNFMKIISKFDVRISTKPVIKKEEFFYKIWILRRRTKKKMHIKQYYPLHLLEKKSNSSSPITLSEILAMIQLNADVPDDFEEYCEKWFRDPSDRICRMDYLMHLKRARRFKKFLTNEEIRSIPFLPCNDADENIKDEQTDDFLDFNNESILKRFGYFIVYLKDKKEYYRLADLESTLEYHGKIVKSYGYDPHTGDFNEKKFPITKEDKQIKNINKDFDNFFQALSQYGDYLKELIKKYNIKPPAGILDKRIAFNIHTVDNNYNSNSEQQHFKFIKVVVDWEYFPDTLTKRAKCFNVNLNKIKR